MTSHPLEATPGAFGRRRRTFGSHLLNEGMRVETLSKLLGHSDVRVTQAAYAQLEDSSAGRVHADRRLRSGLQEDTRGPANRASRFGRGFTWPGVGS